MIVEGGDHLAHLPELIHVDGRDVVCEPEVPLNLGEAGPRHVFVELVGAWVLMLVKGGDTPEIVLLPPAAC